MDFAPLGSHPLRLDFVRPAPPKTGAYQNVVFFGVIALGVVQGIFLGFRFGQSPLAIGIGAIIGAATGVWLARWLRARSEYVAQHVPPLELRTDRLLLPLNANSEKQVELRFEEIDILSLTTGHSGVLSVGGDVGMHRFRLASFVRPDLVPAFFRALSVALETHGGPQALQRIRARTEDRNRFLRSRVIATPAILVLLTLVYAVQRAVGATGMDLDAEALDGFARLGANVRSLVGQGQWWRILTANFLHGFGLHIILNGLAILSLGSIVERFIGWQRFLIVYLASAVGGALASSLWSQGSFSVGASTAVYGLFGAFAVLSLAHRRHLPPGVGQTRRWWTVNAALSIGISLLPFVDKWGHIGGFVVGCLAMTAVYPMRGRLQFGLPTPVGLKVLLAVVLTTFGVAAGLGVEEALANKSYPALMAEMTQRQKEPVEDEDNWFVVLAKADEMNRRAWTIATSSSATSEELKRAVVLAEAADMHRPDEAAILDTVATARYRVGNFEGAVAAELASIDIARDLSLFGKARKLVLGDADNRDFHGSQLVRFSRAQTATKTAYVVVPENDGLTIKGPPGRMWFAVERGPKTLGMVQAYLHDDSFTLTPTDLLAEHLNEGPVELVVLGSTTTMGSLTDVDPPWEFIAWDPEVEKLP